MTTISKTWKISSKSRSNSTTNFTRKSWKNIIIHVKNQIFTLKYQIFAIITTKIDVTILITKLRRWNWTLRYDAKKKFFKKKNNKKQKLCYKCDQSNYFAREHTTRNNIRCRKFNVILKYVLVDNKKREIVENTIFSNIDTKKKWQQKNMLKIEYTRRLRTNICIKNIEKNQITIIYFIFTK